MSTLINDRSGARSSSFNAKAITAFPPLDTGQPSISAPSILALKNAHPHTVSKEIDPARQAVFSEEVSEVRGHSFVGVGCGMK